MGFGSSYEREHRAAQMTRGVVWRSTLCPMAQPLWTLTESYARSRRRDKGAPGNDTLPPTLCHGAVTLQTSTPYPSRMNCYVPIAHDHVSEFPEGTRLSSMNFYVLKPPHCRLLCTRSHSCNNLSHGIIPRLFYFSAGTQNPPV